MVIQVLYDGKSGDTFQKKIKLSYLGMPSKWMKFLPIECFYGYHSMYFMNTSMYYSIFPSFKVAWVHDMMAKRYPENYSVENLEFQNTFFNGL